MNTQLKSAIAISTLALSSILALGSTVQALPPIDNGNSNTLPEIEPLDQANNTTKFTCVPQGNSNIATIGQRPGGEPIPVIIWTSDSSKYFGEKYSAQNRCRIVTEKLNQAVIESGGSLQDVVLMNGQINNQTVMCVVSIIETGCNGKNTLFTLNPKNAKKADEILAQMMQISREGSSAGVIRETRGRIQVRLDDLLKKKVSSSPRTTIKKPKSGGL
jgi:hypothetical protein